MFDYIDETGQAQGTRQLHYFYTDATRGYSMWPIAFFGYSNITDVTWVRCCMYFLLDPYYRAHHTIRRLYQSTGSAVISRPIIRRVDLVNNCACHNIVPFFYFLALIDENSRSIHNHYLLCCRRNTIDSTHHCSLSVSVD